MTDQPSTAAQALADAMTRRWGATLGRFGADEGEEVLAFLEADGWHLAHADTARPVEPPPTCRLHKDGCYQTDSDATLLTLREALADAYSLLPSDRVWLLRDTTRALLTEGSAE